MGHAARPRRREVVQRNNFLIEEAPFTNMDLFLILAWINNSTHHNVWDDIIDPFDATVEVLE